MKQKGLWLSLLTMTISGVSIFANSVFVAKTDPLIFALVRNTFVAVALSGVLLATGKLGEVKKLSLVGWSKLLAIGVIGGGLPFALFFMGLKQIGAVNGNIIQKSLFIWVALLAIPFLKEKVKLGQWIGYGVLFISLFFVGGTYKFTPVSGTWLVLAATILWGLENVISKVALRTISPTVVSWGRMMFGLPVLLVAVALVGKIGLLSAAATYMPMPLIASSLLLVVYVLTWYSALAAAPATFVAAVLVGAPVITAALAGTLTGKIPAQAQLYSLGGISVGILCVLFGINKPTLKKSDTPEELSA